MRDEKRVPPLLRLWLVFFSDDDGTSLWSPWLRKGFRHVEAYSWFADQDRWVHVSPTKNGLAVVLYGAEEGDGRLGQLVQDASLVLRVKGRGELLHRPDIGSCVGAIKALLGVRSRALSPWQLSRHLLAIGAEVVDTRQEDDGRLEGSTGRPEGEGTPRGGDAALGSGQGEVHSGAAAVGNESALSRFWAAFAVRGIW